MKKSYLLGKRYGELSEKEQQALKLMISGSYKAMSENEVTEVTFDLKNGLSVPGEIIEKNNEIVYKIDDKAVIYNPIA